MSGYRLPDGGRVNRAKPLSFRFEGKTYSGYDGDTLASALMANGVSVVGRSFKYHRPRGLLSAGLEEPNGIVQLEDGANAQPNLKATAVELYEGLHARPVNAWPSLKYDLLSVNGLMGRFIPAAFYYKTFMWPDWRLYEPFIRKAAGLGESPDAPDADVYDKRFDACDVLVVGGGPAGLRAAQAASRSGARVMLVEHEAGWGGSLSAQPCEINGVESAAWMRNIVDELTNATNVTLLNRSIAFGFYDHALVSICQRLTDHLPLDQRKGARQRMWKVRAASVILATGAIERPLVFPNNDRPGVMLANAGARYTLEFAAAPGRRVAFSTSNDSTYEYALGMKRAGVDVVAIADARERAPASLVGEASSAGISVLSGMAATNALGGRCVREAEFHAIDDAGKAVAGRKTTLECDALLVSGGWSPVVHLYSQAGGKLQYRDDIHAFTPKSSLQDIVCVGAAAGTFSLSQTLVEAEEAGAAAAERNGFSQKALAPRPQKDADVLHIRPLWRVDASALDKDGAKGWVDFQNDVTDKDVQLAIRENFKSVEHVKRYTTLGMASDQGKTSNVNGIGLMEGALGKPMGEVGTTTFRPPYDPVPIGAFAGRRIGENLSPLKLVAAETHHAQLGAVFDEYGGWRRPAYYAPDGESEHEAVQREARAVREGVGLFEASPLGKIEVYGPDAAEFLNRIYVNNMKTLKPGRCRYGLMLDENGIVYDDGVLARLSERHFIVGTTSGHASDIAERLQEWLQCEWMDLDVVVQDVTTSWAVVNVNGPRARDLLRKFTTSIDFSAEALAHMHFREGEFAGVRCRAQRVSFSGELSYELAVPWGYGASFWNALMKAGEAFGATPFGIEALMALRIEKGFLHIGSDTDGTTLPQDVGFGRVIEKKKADFVGRRSTMRPDALRKDRRHFVGLENMSDDAPFSVGAHIVSPEVGAPPAHSHGWVTSSIFSPNLGKPVALAVVESGRERIGEEVRVWDLDETKRARIIRPGVFDPEGERLNV